MSRSVSTGGNWGPLPSGRFLGSQRTDSFRATTTRQLPGRQRKPRLAVPQAKSPSGRVPLENLTISFGALGISVRKGGPGGCKSNLAPAAAGRLNERQLLRRSLAALNGSKGAQSCHALVVARTSGNHPKSGLACGQLYGLRGRGCGAGCSLGPVPALGACGAHRLTQYERRPSSSGYPRKP